MSSNDPVTFRHEVGSISVRGVGKTYKITHAAAGKTTLREAVIDRLRHPFGNGLETEETFWALRDVSFEIRPGEVIGIIGRNGAGKSTLLKILSRITEPTTGAIDICGRVASLLEVGTGFHPELTGRENVFLNGSILGMSRREIARKFDDIVDFADIEKFLDTPVKRYSSGMYVRLAFSVAAHLDPDILIVDEVLAVGDAGFQKKCLAKIDDVRGQGRTILLISHQLQVIQSIATQALLLDRGRLVAKGGSNEILSQYQGTASEGVAILADAHQSGTGEGKFTSVRFLDSEDNVVTEITQGSPLRICFDVRIDERLLQGNMAVEIHNGEGLALFSPVWNDHHPLIDELRPGTYRFEVSVPTGVLRPGPYMLTLVLAKNEADIVALVSGVELPKILPRADANAMIESRRVGVVYIPCEWSRP